MLTRRDVQLVVLLSGLFERGSGSQIYLPRSTSIERRSKSREPFDPTSAGEGVMTFA